MRVGLALIGRIQARTAVRGIARHRAIRQVTTPIMIITGPQSEQRFAPADPPIALPLFLPSHSPTRLRQ